MKNHFTTILKITLPIIVSMLLSTPAKAQYHLVKGKILDGETPVEFGYIVNKRTQTATETKEEGRFSIETVIGDTLQFSCLGFKDTTFVVTPEITKMMVPEFKVKHHDYALQEVEVRWFYSYSAFKNAFKNLKLEDKNKTINFGITIDKNEILAAARMNSGQAGLTFSTGRKYLTPEQKQAIKIKTNETRMEKYNRLTSHENIEAFTGLKGTSLESFIIYLRTQVKINPDLNEYAIMTEVKEAFENYLALNDTKKDSIQ